MRNTTVLSANIQNVNLELKGVAVPSVSNSFLDYGLDSTQSTFTISNIGMEQLSYFMTPSKEWISISPLLGEVTEETDTITVTINRTALTGDKLKESINIVLVGGSGIKIDTLGVYLNGVFDSNKKYYRIARIGTQTWMEENVNTGARIGIDYTPQDYNMIEKYCNDNLESNCDIYGGLYNWPEMMQNSPSDTGLIGATQGICPVGWHLPTEKEWFVLINYLGGDFIAGGKLKEAGSLHWLKPNTGATNESGFTALPGGNVYIPDPTTGTTKPGFGALGTRCSFWSSTEHILIGSVGWSFNLFDEDSRIHFGTSKKELSLSVRCIKDQPNK